MKLKPLPDAEGFAGAFAGVSHGVLLVAGGANFPDKKPWNGGKKVWHDTIFALEKPDGDWKAAGKLPRPLGYGVSVSHRDGVICVGGSDMDRHYADVFRLEWKAGSVARTELPPLPEPVANLCGGRIGDTLYVAGGLAKPDATEPLKCFYAMDLAATSPKWRKLDPWPGRPRMLAVAANAGGSFCLVGGVDLVIKNGKAERQYLKDGFVYHPDTGWKPMPDLPHPVAATASPAPFDDRGFLVLGGDTGEHVATSPDKHPGFAKQILRFDIAQNKWHAAGELPAPRVTLPCVRWRDAWVLPSGEARPGDRSPDVWSFLPPPK
jgi:N-acetylneuraminic acid mutarotase